MAASEARRIAFMVMAKVMAATRMAAARLIDAAHRLP
jgi:hypothetical protein